VIISEPSNPWMSGPSNLFTKECFELGKRALRPGGFYAQWVQLYSMSPANVKSLVKTFHSVFPEVLVFQTLEEADLILVGSERRFRINVQQIINRMSNPRIADDLARVGVFSIGDMLAHFRLGTNAIGRYTNGVPLNTDDNLLIEFSAPRSLYAETRRSNERELARYHENVLGYLTNIGRTPAEQAEILRSLAQSFLRSEYGLEKDAEEMQAIASRLLLLSPSPAGIGKP